MRSLVIAFVIGVSAAAIPVAAQAHWRHVHRAWHHVWHRGPSYFPVYAAYDALDPSWHVCVWHHEWDGYWDRDCF